MKVKIAYISLLLVCSLSLTGCWGKREVERLMPLMAIGIDQGRKPDTFLITEQYAEPKKGGTTALEVGGWTYSAEVSSAREMNEITSKLVNKTPFLGALTVIVIGEGAAKNGFSNFLDFHQRFPEFRRTSYMVLTKGTAKELLNTKLRLKELPSMFIKDNIETADKLSAFPVVNFGQYLTIMSNGITAPVLPVIEEVKSGDEGIEYEGGEEKEAIEVRLQGAGVINRNRLADFLTDEESKGYMWLEDKVINRVLDTLDVSDEGIHFTGHVQRSTTKHRVRNNEGAVSLEYRIKARVAVDEVLNLEEQVEHMDWIKLMDEAEKRFAQVIQKECELALIKERELRVDFLGIGRHIEEQRPGYWKTIRDQWEEELVDFPVSLTVQVVINNSGMSTNSVMAK